jgi:DNA-binding CsgD family transcriptional regulator
MKNEVISLRNQGKTYDEISSILGISKATISYHCSKIGLGNEIRQKSKPLSDETIQSLIDFSKSHTVSECADEFKIHKSTVRKYINKKRVIQKPEELRRNNYERVKNRRQLHKKMAVDYKGGKCERCGYDKCIWALSFHHKDPSQKDFIISQYSTFKWEKIQKELDKCMLLCNNCHSEEHYNQYQNNRL